MKLGIPISELECLEKISKKLFILTLKSCEYISKMPSNSLEIGQVFFNVRKAGPFGLYKYHRQRFVAVFGLPTELEDIIVRESFERYGLVKRVTRGKFREFPSVENGGGP